MLQALIGPVTADKFIEDKDQKAKLAQNPLWLKTP